MLTTIILTFNETLHIERCIKSVQPISDRIIVIDSYSTDNTIELALANGAEVYQNTFVNQAVQYNWAIANCTITTDWILRIDADEYIDNRTGVDVQEYLDSLNNDISGVIISRKIVFMGKALLHGGWYPKWNLRIYRTGHGICENRWMDEHIVLNQGKSVEWKLDFVDDNLNNLSWWINKHNNYATREAIDYFLTLYSLQNDTSVKASLWGGEASRKRWLKQKYLNFPLFVRPVFNFILRYLLQRGFLDGKQGLIWHFLQGFWYRFLVDAKIWEIKREFGGDKEKIVAFIKEKYKL